ncbi:hypothetical protein [Botryobacter ruber]|uniref:hypothetical protein n=1 Tax=Botryobacter ruber TaxID=2171629 RepID=UPI000F652DAA|nr:hypothetical protein [Botryobacter ruber]
MFQLAYVIGSLAIRMLAAKDWPWSKILGYIIVKPYRSAGNRNALPGSMKSALLQQPPQALLPHRLPQPAAHVRWLYEEEVIRKAVKQKRRQY